MAPRMVRVTHHQDADGWWCESPDVPGWSGAADTYAELVKLAEDGIAFALGRRIDVVHRSADSPLAAMIARGEVRPGNGTRYVPKPVKGRGSGKSASEYVSEGRR